MREQVEAWVAGHGRCGIMAPAGRRSDTVTALTLRPDVGESRSCAPSPTAAGRWRPGSSGDEDRLIRIGHMGDVTPDQLALLLETIEPLL